LLHSRSNRFRWDPDGSWVVSRSPTSARWSPNASSFLFLVNTLAFSFNTGRVTLKAFRFPAFFVRSGAGPFLFGANNRIAPAVNPAHGEIGIRRALPKNNHPYPDGRPRIALRSKQGRGRFDLNRTSLPGGKLGYRALAKKTNGRRSRPN